MTKPTVAAGLCSRKDSKFLLLKTLRLISLGSSSPCFQEQERAGYTKALTQAHWTEMVWVLGELETGMRSLVWQKGRMWREGGMEINMCKN